MHKDEQNQTIFKSTQSNATKNRKTYEIFVIHNVSRFIQPFSIVKWNQHKLLKQDEAVIKYCLIN